MSQMDCTMQQFKFRGAVGIPVCLFSILLSFFSNIVAAVFFLWGFMATLDLCWFIKQVFLHQKLVGKKLGVTHTATDGLINFLKAKECGLYTYKLANKIYCIVRLNGDEAVIVLGFAPYYIIDFKNRTLQGYIHESLVFPGVIIDFVLFLLGLIGLSSAVNGSLFLLFTSFVHYLVFYQVLLKKIDDGFSSLISKIPEGTQLDHQQALS